MLQTVSKTIIGNGTNTIGTTLRGKVLAVKVVADTNVTNNFDIALTGAVTGIPILTDTTVANNATTWWFPRALVAKQADGAAATDAFAEIPLVKEAITCVVANAGTTGTITVTVIYDSED